MRDVCCTRQVSGYLEYLELEVQRSERHRLVFTYHHEDQKDHANRMVSEGNEHVSGQLALCFFNK